MRKGNHFTGYVVIAMIAMFHMMLIGCNSELSAPTKAVETDLHNAPTAQHFTDQPDLTDLAAYLSFETLDMEVSTDLGTVGLYDVRMDEMSHSMVVAYSYVMPDKSVSERILAVSGTASADGATISVLDRGNNLKAGVSVVPDPADSMAYTLTEWTASDTLSIHRKLSGDRMHETYYMHGNSLSIDFTQVELGQYFAHSPKESRQSSLVDTSTVPSAYEHISAAMTAFGNFYTNPGTIENNVDGEMMLALAGNLEFQNWLEQTTGRPGLANAQKLSVEELCDMAETVATFKCGWGGGVSNFVCVAAVGVVAACVIYKFFMWISS